MTPPYDPLRPIYDVPLSGRDDLVPSSTEVPPHPTEYLEAEVRIADDPLPKPYTGLGDGPWIDLGAGRHAMPVGIFGHVMGLQNSAIGFDAEKMSLVWIPAPQDRAEQVALIRVIYGVERIDYVSALILKSMHGGNPKENIKITRHDDPQPDDSSD